MLYTRELSSSTNEYFWIYTLYFLDLAVVLHDFKNDTVSTVNCIECLNSVISVKSIFRMDFFVYLQIDKKTGKQKLWIYKDKMTGRPKGEATVTYDDPETATAAINWFSGK